MVKGNSTDEAGGIDKICKLQSDPPKNGERQKQRAISSCSGTVGWAGVQGGERKVTKRGAFSYSILFLLVFYWDETREIM